MCDVLVATNNNNLILGICAIVVVVGMEMLLLDTLVTWMEGKEGMADSSLCCLTHLSMDVAVESKYSLIFSPVSVDVDDVGMRAGEHSTGFYSISHFSFLE